MKTLTTIVILAALSLSACDNVKLVQNENTSTCALDSSAGDFIATKFEGVPNADLQTFAINLLPCVGDPDPEIRDGIVFESFSYLLRNDLLTDATKTELLTSLLADLTGPLDKDGFLKPFAALDLSELARADRIDPYLTDLQRVELISAAAEYMEHIDDYRGYDDKEGWRHGVAHTADLALQLVLNDQVIDPQIRAFRRAITTQITPENGHAYIYGESERLARPILYMARRGTFSKEDWDDWFAKIGDPAPFEDWNAVFKSEAGLAKLHNTKAFVNAIYINASLSQNENVKMLTNASLEVLKKLP